MNHQPSRPELEAQADRIEQVLASHRVPGRIPGGLVTPRLFRFQFIPRLGAKLSRLKSLSEEIAFHLGASDCRIYRQEGRINIDISRNSEENVQLRNVCKSIKRLPPCASVLGVDQEGFPLVLALGSPEISHVLVSGATGAGKTVLTRSMITSLAMHNPQSQLQLALIDLKHRGFAPFAGLAHLLVPVACSAEAALDLLGRLVTEMERRDSERVTLPHVVLFVDELAELVMLEQGKAVKEFLTRLTQRGREAGLHVVACTQKPLASLIGSLVKSNFPTRIVGKVASADDARVAAGIGGTGAEHLRGHGEFIMIAGGEEIRFQSALVEPPEIRRVVAQITRAKRESVPRRRRKQIPRYRLGEAT
jgi:S-DNA-T family DNA segregation ATPase FtsK/SpoIIIE